MDQPISPRNRISVDRPDYRFAPSKNPYWAKLRDLDRGAYLDHAAEDHAGRWRQELSPGASPAGAGRRRLHVEIGCNGGHVMLERAALAPEDLFLGVDWKFKQIYFGMDKARKRGIGNTAFLRTHAERLHYVFGPGEIDRLYVYFPDPWPKKGQLKKRFFTAEWLRRVAPLLARDGEFEVRTDHDGYFEWMKQAVAEAADHWETAEITHDRHAGNPDRLELRIPDVTLFERLFIRDGIPIKRLLLTPKSPDSARN